MATNAEIEQQIFDGLSKDPPDPDALAAVNNYTRLKMTCIWHIPMRFFIFPGFYPEDLHERYFKRLQEELKQKGYLELAKDCDEPECLREIDPERFGTFYGRKKS